MSLHNSIQSASQPGAVTSSPESLSQRDVAIRWKSPSGKSPSAADSLASVNRRLTRNHDALLDAARRNARDLLGRDRL